MPLLFHNVTADVRRFSESIPGRGGGIGPYAIGHAMVRGWEKIFLNLQGLDVAVSIHL
jgi:hypothetical protein